MKVRKDSKHCISKNDISDDKENIWDPRAHSNVPQTIPCWVSGTSKSSEEKSGLSLWKGNETDIIIFKHELAKIRKYFSVLLGDQLQNIPV